MISSADLIQVHRRAVIWLDHVTAKIFTMGLSGVSSFVVHARLSSSHLHHHANAIGSGRVREDPDFLAAVGKAIEACDGVLILGPGIENMALLHYLRKIRPEIVLRMETSDHPTDEEVVAIGRKHFGFSETRS